MPTKSEIIEATYKKYLGSRAQTLARIKKEDQRRSEEDDDYEPSGITKKDVDDWFLNHDQLAPALKAPYKTRFNSFVADEPRNTFQVDLFNYKYEQKDFPDNPPPPHGLIAVDVFTKQVFVVPMRNKLATSWKDAMDKIVDKMGRPQFIMTDPDSSITSIEMDEWFRRNKDIKHIMTRRHAAFAERALRDFKLIMTKKIKTEVKPWPEYLNETLHRMNTKMQSADDDEIHEHKATGFTPEDAAKPENWFEVHNSMEIQAKHRRKYPPLKVGDKVKVYRQRSALSKEVEGDYKYDPTVITGIEKSLGQTFYKVEGVGKPFLRSDILLIKESEEGAEAAEPADETGPYMSYKRKRIIAREKNKELREQRAKQVAEAKEAAKRAREDAKAAIAAARAR